MNGLYPWRGKNPQEEHIRQSMGQIKEEGRNPISENIQPSQGQITS